MIMAYCMEQIQVNFIEKVIMNYGDCYMIKVKYETMAYD